MRILALRGENLASLAGKFELDLAEGPLAESGLIAITGPTGAGKSTLLDAMCLALFDRTPRLGGRGAAVGFLHEEDQKTLSSGDPRCVLRRGASSGHAEVDFLGVRGERWRARWSVRRARGRALGRLQNQQVSLENLDTGVLAGGTKTQTLAAIEEALGLDYDGFCRSALLAQGEFAGFLRAKPEERAALLERVTGTEIYGQLSIAAHSLPRGSSRPGAPSPSKVAVNAPGSRDSLPRGSSRPGTPSASKAAVGAPGSRDSLPRGSSRLRAPSASKAAAGAPGVSRLVAARVVPPWNAPSVEGRGQRDWISQPDSARVLPPSANVTSPASAPLTSGLNRSPHQPSSLGLEIAAVPFAAERHGAATKRWAVALCSAAEW